MKDEKLDIVRRTKIFAVEVIRIFGRLPKRTDAQVLGRQMLRSGTSVGAHVREGKRSRSDAEMISKFEVALQELEETLYWFELLEETGISEDASIAELTTEANELIAILVASVRTIKKRKST
jgi:four helix bundle protein